MKILNIKFHENPTSGNGAYWSGQTDGETLQG